MCVCTCCSRHVGSAPISFEGVNNVRTRQAVYCARFVQQPILLFEITSPGYEQIVSALALIPAAAVRVQPSCLPAFWQLSNSVCARVSLVYEPARMKMTSLLCSTWKTSHKMISWFVSHHWFHKQFHHFACVISSLLPYPEVVIWFCHLLQPAPMCVRRRLYLRSPHTSCFRSSKSYHRFV